MNIVDPLLFLAGLLLLVGGAESLVRGASRLAITFGVAPLIVGLTIVAFGTSAPEAAIGWMAAARGEGDLAVGNVIGSNIFNILVVLGLTAAVAPLAFSKEMAWIKIPLLAGLSIATAAMALDGWIGPLDALLLALGLVGYTLLTWRLAARSRSERPAAPAPGGRWWNGGLIVAGLLLLVGGSRALVEGASGLARGLGVGELVIGLTIVAAGTSLPEVATSVVAALRGEREIAVANAIGSCLLNLLLVLSLTAWVAPGGLPVPAAALRVDLPVMIGTAVVCLPIPWLGYRLGRWQGVGLFAAYVCYVVWLVRSAAG